MKDELLWWDMVRAGDENSFKKLFERYHSTLFNYGYKFTKDEDIIEDSVQEIFVIIWCKRDNIGPTGSVKNYLLKSFRRLLVRAIQRDNRIFSLGNYGDSTLPFEIELPHDISMMKKERENEIRQQLDLALSKMTARQREIIHLKYFEELSYEEISDVMGLSSRDTYKLYYRAIDSLRKYMGASNLIALLVVLNYLRSSS